MIYTDYQEKLNKTLRELLPKASEILLEEPDFLIEEIGDMFNLTMGEIGELCELVRQVITKERKPEDFEAGLKEKLEDADNDPLLTGNITATVTQKIFLKLLPALGIKVPLDMAMATVVKPKTTSTEESARTGLPAETGAKAGVEFNKARNTEEAKESEKDSLKEKTEAEVSIAGLALPTLPQISSEPPEEFMNRNTPTLPAIPAKKPPVVEVSHERMSDNPIESLIKMVEGKVNGQELQNHFRKLPQSLKVALESVDSAKKVVDIGRKYALHVDKLGELGAETGMVILGFTHPGQFLGRLARRLGMSENAIQPIAQEINAEIFLKIREALKEINGEGGIRITAEPAGVASYPAINSETPATRNPSRLPNSGQGAREGFLSAGSEFRNSQSPIPIKPGIIPPTPDTEETLDREAILRDIENPTPISGVESRIMNPAFAQKLRTGRQESKTKPAPTIPSNLPTGEIESGIKNQESRMETIAEIPQKNAPSTTSQAPKPVKVEESIVDRKLSSATMSTKSESNYTADLYREPLG